MSKRQVNPTGHAVSTAASSSNSTVFFYSQRERPYGVMCQWTISPMAVPTSSLEFLTTTDHVTATTTHTASTILAKYSPSLMFSSAEQFFTFCKALYFADSTSCNKILTSKVPKVQKQLGREVKGYDDYRWTKVKSRVVRVGNFYKFAQPSPASGRGGGNGKKDSTLRDVLLGTGEKELAEASERDRIWGIGFSAADAEGMRAEWGENRLGKALMAVRARLAEQVKKEEAGESAAWDWDGEMEEEDA